MSNHSELWEEQECAEAFGRDAMRMIEEGQDAPLEDDRYEPWDGHWPDAWFAPFIGEVIFRGRVVGDDADAR